jgi:nucleoside-diphosphate-sugar epimerase
MAVGKVLITGATGFVGAHLAALLLREGFLVAATFRGTSPVPTARLPAAADIEWVEVSDAPRWMLANVPQTVLHLATEYGKSSPPSACIASNVLFPLTLLEAACRAGCGLFLNTDSFFGKPRFAYPHMRAYTWSKADFARWGAAHASTLSTRFLTLRLEHVYGEHDNANKFIPFVMGELAAGNPQLKLTDGRQKRDFIHVDDVVSAYLQVIRLADAVPSDIAELEVGCGHAIPVREMVKIAADVVQSKTDLLLGALPQREGEIMDSSADNRSLLALGWRPEVGLREGLARVHRSAVRAVG